MQECSSQGILFLAVLEESLNLQSFFEETPVPTQAPDFLW